jgi:ubiquinol-cytochrome c reductase iron-sulfur subunit
VTGQQERTQRRATRRIAVAFVVATLAAVAFVAVYVAGGQVQLEGLTLAVAFAALGYGFAAWARYLLPDGDYVEEHEPFRSPPEARESFMREVSETGPGGFPPLLRRTLGVAVLTLAAAALVPLRSLLVRGPRPAEALDSTAWGPGVRVVTVTGERLRPEDLEEGTVVTVYPEGFSDVTSNSDFVTLLLRVDPRRLRLPEGREDWAVTGIVAYSKLCTHAGCPVGLFEQETQQLLCPCHQSVFDVLRGAVPVAGPAARALPQLPLEVGPDGYLQAAGDFSGLVGPTWSRPL